MKGKGELFDQSIKLCKDRLIPENIWNDWYVAIDGSYKNRLIIPYKDNNNKIYNWQGKSLYEWQIPKYKNRLGENFNNIYVYYAVDRNKPVIVFEGVLDALFVKNSVSFST